MDQGTADEKFLVCGVGRLGDSQEKYKLSLESKIGVGGEKSREEIMGMEILVNGKSGYSCKARVEGCVREKLRCITVGRGGEVARNGIISNGKEILREGRGYGQK